MGNLKPCPFCGGEARVHRSEPLGGLVAECMLAADGLCIGNGRVSADINKTIRIWNTRTSGWISVADALPPNDNQYIAWVGERAIVLFFCLNSTDNIHYLAYVSV